jgi:hypothetical protein
LAQTKTILAHIGFKENRQYFLQQALKIMEKSLGLVGNFKDKPSLPQHRA